MKQFEGFCRLSKGIWPGDPLSDPEKGISKWFFRWRGRDTSGKMRMREYDKFENLFEFKRDEQGQLTIEGTWMENLESNIWKATKIEERKTFRATEGTVLAVWNGYR